MNLKTRSLTLIIVLALFVAGGFLTFAADWFPWGSSKSEPTPVPAPASPHAATGRQGAVSSFADIAAGAEPAVVNISTSQTVKNEGFRGFGPLPGPGNPEGRGGGPSPFGENDPFEQFFR